MLRLVLSPDGADDSLTVQQDARVYAGLFDGDETARLELASNRYAYVHVARGSVTVNGVEFKEGDGARVRGEEALTFTQGHDAEVPCSTCATSRCRSCGLKRPNELSTGSPETFRRATLFLPC